MDVKEILDAPVFGNHFYDSAIFNKIPTFLFEDHPIEEKERVMKFEMEVLMGETDYEPMSVEEYKEDIKELNSIPADTPDEEVLRLLFHNANV